jgi:hypothetical protein
VTKLVSKLGARKTKFEHPASIYEFRNEHRQRRTLSVVNGIKGFKIIRGELDERFEKIYDGGKQNQHFRWENDGWSYPAGCLCDHL